MLILSRYRLLYFLYFSIVVMCYLLGMDVFPGYQKLFFLYGVDLAAIVFLVIYLVYFRKIYLNKKGVFVFGALLFYLFFLSASKIFNYEIISAIRQIASVGLFWISFFLVFFFSSTLFSRKMLLKPFYYLSIIIVLVSLFVLAGYRPVFYSSENDQSLISSLSMLGFSGVYSNQNRFSVALFISVVVSFIYYIGFEDCQRKYGNLIALVFLLVSVILILMTMSRAALMACFIFLFFIALKAVKNKRFLVLSVISSIAVFFLLVNFSELFFTLMDRLSSDGMSFRDIIWADALNVFRKNIYLGSGNYSYSVSDGATMTAHNVYIQLLASSGLFAFIAWLAFMLIGLLSSITNLLVLRFRDNKLDIIFSSAFIAVIAHQAFEVTILSFSNLSALFLVMLSMVINKEYSVLSTR